MPLQVIGAGFGRTGTNSLKIALEKLGYQPCHHMKEVVPSKQQLNYFAQLASGRKLDWDIVFADFQASVDWPSAKYHAELAEQFPDAKIVLSTRDVDKWYTSTRETIFAVSQAIPAWLRLLSPRVRTLHRMVNETVWNGVFNGRFLDEKYAKQVYLDHIEAVKAHYPAERLLLHSASDGWLPLCEFLNRDLPQEPYPQVNEAQEIKRVVKILRVLGYLPIALIATLATLFYYLS